MRKKIKKPSAKAGPTKSALTSDKPVLIPWVLLLIGITAVCLYPMLKNGFTNWDDEQYVVENALLQGPDWKGIFSQPVASNYHPLTVSTLALNYQISKQEPFSYLLWNYLLHLLNTALVFFFIYKISEKNVWVAWLTALVFAIHPMHVESVAWISERKDVLYTCFFLLALIQYWKYLENGTRRALWACFVFFTLSLLSKPAAIVLPFVLLLLDYWKGRGDTQKAFLEKLPFLALALLFAVITFQIQSPVAVQSLERFPIWLRPVFASYVLLVYLVRFVVPYPLSAFHPYPPVGDLGWQVYAAPVALLALFVWVWANRKSKLLVFGILFYLINLLLVSQLVSFGSTIVSERYTYVPYIGLAFLSSSWLYAYCQKLPKQFLWAVPALLALSFGPLTFQRTKVWENSATLWSDVLSHYPNVPEARTNRANYNYKLALQPAHSKEAEALYRQGLEDCNIALAGSYSWEPGYRVRGSIYMKLNRFEDAFADFNRALSLDPDNEFMLNNRGTILYNQFQKYPEALADFDRAISINPQGLYYLNRSRCHYYLGNMEQARADVQTAMQKGTTVAEQYRKLLNL